MYLTPWSGWTVWGGGRRFAFCKKRPVQGGLFLFRSTILWWKSGVRQKGGRRRFRNHPAPPEFSNRWLLRLCQLTFVSVITQKQMCAKFRILPYSSAATCKANGICFRKLLEDVLPRLNSTPAGQIDSLLPREKQSCQWAPVHYYEERMPSDSQPPDGITFSCSNLFKTLSPIFSFTMGLAGRLLA